MAEEFDQKLLERLARIELRFSPSIPIPNRLFRRIASNATRNNARPIN